MHPAGGSHVPRASSRDISNNGQTVKDNLRAVTDSHKPTYLSLSEVLRINLLGPSHTDGSEAVPSWPPFTEYV